jgi:tetratricopeptide (TPR) repeat protein
MAFAHFRHATYAAGLAFLIVGHVPAAQATTELDSADQPSSLSGSYLAGRNADISNDIDAALAYLTYALETDRGNPVLGDRVLTLQLAAGEIEPALELAEKLTITDNKNPTARIALAASAFKSDRYALAKRELESLRETPLTTLTAGLLRAWADQGLGHTDEALRTVNTLTGPTWFSIFKDYHSALLNDAAGREAEADAAITATYDTDRTPIGVVDAYARIKARNGESEAALNALKELGGNRVNYPHLKQLVADLEAGKVPPPVTPTAQAGAAEVFYGLGSAIGTEDGTSLAASYLQLAYYLDPSNGLFNVALGDIFQRSEQCEKAVEIYQRVLETSPLYRNAAIQTGICLDTLGRTDDAANRIKRIVDSDPNDIEAAIALGSLYRSHDRFAEASDAYSIGIKSMTDETEADWRIYYFRGIAYERTKRWQLAEADFKRALELNPNQPQVLNYLGYSWVDMGLNLDEALNMIRTAVDLRPNDGYIIDSLGWAYYRLGRYEDAVEQLEQAVELRPEDPVINDHLGDAYWQVGRKREAAFQWTHARDLDPEEQELPKILAKIENGLDGPTPAGEAPAPPDDAATETEVGAVDSADGTSATSSVTVENGDSLWTIAERVYGNADLYFLIFEANKDRIVDPNIIHPGMTLTIPTPQTN